MKFKICVCEDEINMRKEILDMLKEEFVDCEFCEYSSGEELLSKGDTIDILLLDIELPGLYGMDAAHILRKSNNEVNLIFLTSHEELMPKAFVVRHLGI